MKSNPYNALIYSVKRNQQKVKRQYIKWREDQIPPIPYRCDINDCILNTSSPLWNNEKLTLILDHINGVPGDNRVKNLRLICPNCNSQLPTTGGRNKGKRIMYEGGYSLKENNHFNHFLPTTTGLFTAKFGKFEVKINSTGRMKSS